MTMNKVILFLNLYASMKAHVQMMGLKNFIVSQGAQNIAEHKASFLSNRWLYSILKNGGSQKRRNM